ncbi:MAG: hypothetical protein ABI467_22230, partial [Kofleriaceae bacterium]
EIEEETAKLESYRQLKAPVEPVAAVREPAMTRTPTGSKPPVVPSAARRSTQGMPAVGNTRPPPPPTRTSQQMPVLSPQQQAITAPTGKVGRRQVESGDLAWDDDELETQIYDNPEDDPRNQPKPVQPEARARPGGQSGKQASIPLSAPPTPAPELAASPAATLTGTGPDLSSLVSTAKGWEAGPLPGTNGSSSHGSTVPPPFANGSGRGPTPAAPPLSPYAAPIPSIPQSRETAAPVRLVSNPEQMFDPMASFGSGMLARKGPRQAKSKSVVYLAVGGAAVAVIAVIVVITMTGGNKTHPIASAGSDAPAVVAGDQMTGFDLYVVPGGVTTWRLDGESRTDKLPSRIRGIAPGEHQVSIDAPPGFMSQNEPVSVEAGKPSKVEITLKPIEGISGDFESTPPGAKVSLIIDGNRQPLGDSPQKAPLDPRKTYQVLFEKDGYVSVNKPIVFTGALDEKVVVNLEKAGAATVAEAGSAEVATHPVTNPIPNPVTHPVTHPANPVTHPASGGTVVHPASGPASGAEKVAANPLPGEKSGGEKSGGEKTNAKTGGEKTGGEKVASGGGEGTLLIGSKPPCDIFIDGSSTGLHTPAKDIKLPAGKHKVTLVNNEFSLKETFTVEIKPDAPNKVIKDFSAKINPAP